MNDIELKDLCGERVLTGVDRLLENSGDDCEVLNFTLDGKTYTAKQDPDDGYRSSMEYLRVSDKPTTNTFPPVKVIGSMMGGNNEALELTDATTGKLVLRVGTENTDDYYPYWVANFSPENMACNQSANNRQTHTCSYIQNEPIPFPKSRKSRTGLRPAGRNSAREGRPLARSGCGQGA